MIMHDLISQGFVRLWKVDGKLCLANVLTKVLSKCDVVREREMMGIVKGELQGAKDSSASTSEDPDKRKLKDVSDPVSPALEVTGDDAELGQRQRGSGE